MAYWLIARLQGLDAARKALHDVAPQGKKERYVARALGQISPHL